METKGPLQFEIIINVSVSSFCSICYVSTAIINNLILSVRDRLYMSESDVHRRQILTYKDGAITVLSTKLTRARATNVQTTTGLGMSLLKLLYVTHTKCDEGHAAQSAKYIVQCFIPFSFVTFQLTCSHSVVYFGTGTWK